MDSSVGGIHICFGDEDGCVGVTTSDLTDPMEEYVQGVAVFAVWNVIFYDS